MKLTIFRDYKEEGWESMEIYADNLVKNLQKLGEKNLEIKQFVGCKSLSQRFPKERKIVRYFFRYCVNPPLAFFHQGEINHITDQANAHLLSLLDPKRTIITCHDLIVPFWVEQRQIDDLSTKEKIKYKIRKWRIRNIKKAAKIIAVSQATKKEIVEQLGVNPVKIVVIPEGVENFFQKIEDKHLLLKFRKKYQLPDKFFLHVGSCADYKNIEGILHLISRLVNKNRDLYLVKVGQFWQDKQRKLIKKLNLGKRIKLLGYLPRKELPFIYNLAKGLIYLSFIEGFALPVLEAMKCGCPVIVSDISALRELVDSAGLVANIFDRKNLMKTPPARGLAVSSYEAVLPRTVLVRGGASSPSTEARGIRLAAGVIKNIQKFINDKNLRCKYIERGLIRAKQFTWEKTAQKTYQVYEDLLRKNK